MSYSIRVGITMKRRVLAIILLMFTLNLSSPVHANGVTSEPSASIILPGSEASKSQEYLLKQRVIEKVLTRYNSQLVDEADTFVKYAYEYNIDPYLLISISGLESFFGRHMIPGNYNAWGWGGGYIELKSWDNAIFIISRALRQNYYDKGAKDIHDVGRKYAESPTWSVRVQYFMDQFYKEEAKMKKLDRLL